MKHPADLEWQHNDQSILVTDAGGNAELWMERRWKHYNRELKTIGHYQYFLVDHEGEAPVWPSNDVDRLVKEWLAISGLTDAKVFA